MIGALIGAGTSLLGGLFGNSAKKKQLKAEQAARAEDRKWFLEDRDNERGYARGAYDRLVSDSEAAGFNPLTALRAGGAPGSTSNASPFLSTQTLTGGGSSPLGDSLQNVGNIIANFDPFEDKLREQQFQVQQAQLRSLELSNTAASKKMFDVPAASGRRTVAAGPSVGNSVVINGQTYRGFGDDGAIEDAYSAVRMPDGTYIRVPNPNLPDGEQIIVPPIGVVDTDTSSVWSKTPTQWGAEARKKVNKWAGEYFSPWVTPLFK